MEPAEIRQLNVRLEVTRRELRTLEGQLQERGSTRARLEGALRVLAPSERTAIAQQLRQVASEQAFLQTRTTYLMGRRDQLERDLYAGRLRAKGRADLARRIANAMGTVREHLRNGQPAMPPARRAAADLMELMAELGKLAEDARFTGQARQRVAA